MTREWPIADPDPVGDLPSDVTFGAWLEGLDPLVVIRDLDVGLSGTEKSHLAYLRRRAAASRSSREQQRSGNQKEGST